MPARRCRLIPREPQGYFPLFQSVSAGVTVWLARLPVSIRSTFTTITTDILSQFSVPLIVRTIPRPATAAVPTSATAGRITSSIPISLSRPRLGRRGKRKRRTHRGGAPSRPVRRRRCSTTAATAPSFITTGLPAAASPAPPLRILRTRAGKLFPLAISLLLLCGHAFRRHGQWCV